jgi:hypothetical protein
LTEPAIQTDLGPWGQTVLLAYVPTNNTVKKAPVKGPSYLVAVVVVTVFDDDFLAAAIVVPAAVPAPIMVTKLSARAAEFPMLAELSSITVMIAADAKANLFTGVGYRWCCNCDSGERCKRNTQLPHFRFLS